MALTGIDQATSIEYLKHLDEIAEADVKGLRKAQASYGNSWKQRGGVGAFMMLARKWDRLENRVQAKPLRPVDRPEDEAMLGDRYDVFEHCIVDERSEGVIDDIRDLRRYLLLVEAEIMARGVRHDAHRDNKED
ncbi:MAG: hypothetical protein ACYST6_20010 [Planctomycetota bacterium]|jgi:hypothetical protein